MTDEIPSGVSIESASYIEQNNEMKMDEVVSQEGRVEKDNSEAQHIPKLFTDEQSHQEDDLKERIDEKNSEQLFDQDVNEDEDFEIPAFLRRQKF